MPWTIFETPIGMCGLAWSDKGVTSFQLPEASAEATLERLLARAADAGRKASPRAAPPWVRSAIEQVRAHLGGTPQDFTKVPLDLARVSTFNAKVYRELRKIPAGATISYGELAKLAGSPDAARAVGRAMGQNPVPVLVPCQRVLAAGGKPGGFSAYGGLVTKDRLLTLDGAKVNGQASWSAAAPATPQASLFAIPDAQNALPYDPREAIAHLSKADAKLGKHITQAGPFSLRLKDTEGIFSALAEAIVYQQLNGKAAGTIFGRVRALYPDGHLDPKRILATDDDDLRRAGLSRGKLASLRDLSERAATGKLPTLPQLASMDDDAIVEHLTEVRGIGRWTVEMLLMFRLGRPDVLPVGDYGIRKGFAALFHRGEARAELATADDLTRRAERWRPFRSVASWYLWRAAEGATKKAS